MSEVRSIPVRDANGDQLTVYEFVDRRFLRKVRRWKLDCGELVEKIDDKRFKLATGEVFTRIE